MAEISQYSFSFVELAEALIKRQDVHEGQWVVAIEFGVTIGMMGPTLDVVRPGAMVLANQVQLVRATAGQSPPHLIVDASVVNPAKAKTSKKAK